MNTEYQKLVNEIQIRVLDLETKYKKIMDYTQNTNRELMELKRMLKRKGLKVAEIDLKKDVRE